MQIRCKFMCESKTIRKDGVSVKLIPVTHGSPENESFYKWTPFGEMTLGLLSLETGEGFIPAKEYYINISEV